MFRRMVKILICCLMLMIYALPEAHASLSIPPSAKWNESTQNALIQGEASPELEGQALTILIKKADAEITTPADIGYLNQITIGEGGKYRHKFYFPYDVNDYELIMRVGDKSIGKSVDVAAVSDTKFVTGNLNFNTRVDGEKAYIEFSSKLSNDFANDTTYQLYIACYDEQGGLLEVNASKRETLLYDAVEEIASVEIPNRTSRVKGFLWSSTSSLIPLAGVTEFKKDFYALSWNKTKADYENIYPMFCINDVSAITDTQVGICLKTDSYETAALKMKEYMSTVPAGKRAVLCNMSRVIWGDDATFDNWFWWDAGIDTVITQLNGIFDEYSKIDGPEIDAMIWDFEAGCDISNIRYEYCGASAKLSDVQMEARFDAIIADERYSEIRNELAERGFRFYEGSEHNELYYYWNKGASGTADDYNSYYIGINFAEKRKADYLNEIYSAASVYFPDIYFSNYGAYNSEYDEGGHWVSDDEQKKRHLDPVPEADRISSDVGTHASPVLYGKFSDTLVSNPPKGYVGEYAKTPFNNAFQMVRRLKNCAVYTGAEKAQIMPWIGMKAWTWGNTIPMANTPYYDEAMIHIALCNPEALLFFNTFDDDVETADGFTVSEGGLNSVLEELNELVGYADRKPLTTALPDVNVHYMLTGIYSNGRNIWRITPDTDVCDKADFLIDGDTPTFQIGNQRIVFPEGSEIIEDKNISGGVGYWVSSPLGTYPTESSTNN